MCHPNGGQLTEPRFGAGYKTYNRDPNALCVASIGRVFVPLSKPEILVGGCTAMDIPLPVADLVGPGP